MQPTLLLHTAYRAYLCCAIPNINNPLDDSLRTKLIPTLTGRPPPSDLECILFALPARLGGLGITIPSKQADQEHQSSLLVTSALQDHIISQDEDYGYDIISKQLESKAFVRQQNKKKSSKDACDLTDHLPENLWRSVNLAGEKGSSTWLTVMPLTEHGFALHKGAFHDALALRYGWTPDRLPPKCVCGAFHSVEHALSCAKGGHQTLLMSSYYTVDCLFVQSSLYVNLEQ